MENEMRRLIMTKTKNKLIDTNTQKEKKRGLYYMEHTTSTARLMPKLRKESKREVRWGALSSHWLQHQH